MFVEHETYFARAKIQQIKKEEITPKRGNIYDRKGRELAVSLEKESLFVDPLALRDYKDIEKLKAYVKVNAHLLENSTNRNRRFIWIERKIDSHMANQIKALKIEGLGFVTEGARFYPKGFLASHVIGFVNIDEQGIEGLESYYDRYLKAQKSAKTVLRDARGKKLSEGDLDEIKGSDLFLTIDEGLQYIVEKHLDWTVKKWQANSAIAIMMDPFTGEILALANRPTYDPNSLKSLKNPAIIRNRAITDLYEPGSTFKIVTATAALEEGIVKTNTKFDCSLGHIEVGGKKVKDAHKHGVLTFEEVIQKSSNVGTIKIAMMLGRERLYNYIKKFGFGEKTGVDLPGEISGYVRPLSRWSGTSMGAIPIGQEVGVTALQILRAYSAIANGGYLVKPYVVSEIRSPEGKIVYKAVIDRERIVSEKTAYTLREILKKVTQEGGTATTAKVEGNNVAGKTGTAQKYDPKTKRYSKDKYVSSFVGFIPAENPRIALIVVVHDPRGAHYGGVVAGPVFRAISDEAMAYLNVPRDDAKDKGLLVTFDAERSRKVANSR
ncbi:MULTISPECIES: peptidoglycan D,D-transpeptidase FtsI family protein [Thermodesulfovibrio]|jgi:cell division protein FtsI (penicillin-binding protein 3)|uniref:peptidoglycan D,D-transpeptidase FtsI family protein n=1 Tax=Thermodesulfovibrio TaxID=28261 RepID=UPI0026181A0F|nr:penicillin-binding protein 2 [Thermodesulfovibrio sp.]